MALAALTPSPMIWCGLAAARCLVCAATMSERRRGEKEPMRAAGWDRPPLKTGCGLPTIIAGMIRARHANRFAMALGRVKESQWCNVDNGCWSKHSQRIARKGQAAVSSLGKNLVCSEADTASVRQIAVTQLQAAAPEHRRQQQPISCGTHYCAISSSRGISSHNTHTTHVRHQPLQQIVAACRPASVNSCLTQVHVSMDLQRTLGPPTKSTLRSCAHWHANCWSVQGPGPCARAHVQLW